MEPPTPLAPRILARFTPDEPEPKVFANFGPQPPTKPILHASFDPKAWEDAQEALVDLGIASPYPEPPAPAPLTLEQQFLYGIRSLLSPDNFQLQYKFVTGQLNAGEAYDYAIPAWCRHFLLTNRSTNPSGGTTSGDLYYWYDNPQQGSHVLPQNYATLTSTQSISENSQFAWVTLFADSTATDQAWEIRFSGRPADSVGQNKAIIAPLTTEAGPTGGPAGGSTGGGAGGGSTVYTGGVTPGYEPHGGPFPRGGPGSGGLLAEEDEPQD